MKQIILLAFLISCISAGYGQSVAAPTANTPNVATATAKPHKTHSKPGTNSTGAATSTVASTSTTATTSNAGKQTTQETGVKKHLKSDGTPDKRYTSNKHLKADGTKDKRFKENKPKL